MESAAPHHQFLNPLRAAADPAFVALSNSRPIVLQRFAAGPPPGDFGRDALTWKLPTW
jgi:hypothetical protein